MESSRRKLMPLLVNASSAKPSASTQIWVRQGTRSEWEENWDSRGSRPVPTGSYAARGSTTSMLRRVHAGSPAPPLACTRMRLPLAA